MIRPARADLVATVGETTGEAAMKRMLETMRRDPVGSQILKDKPRISVRCCTCRAPGRPLRRKLHAICFGYNPNISYQTAASRYD